MAATHPSTFFQQTPTNKATTPFASTRNTPPDTTKLHLVKPIPAATTTAAQSWSFLIPTILVASLGAAFIPNFALGLAVGVIVLLTTLIMLMTVAFIFSMQDRKDKTKSEHINETKMKPEYIARSESDKLKSTLGAPIFEELIFRGIMQPLIIAALTLLVPALACIPVLSTGLNLAMLSSVLITAVSFGWAHKSNAENNNIQVYSATLGGLIMGVLALQFGLGAAIATHIMNNTFGVCLETAAAYQEETKTPEEETEAVVSFAP